MRIDKKTELSDEELVELVRVSDQERYVDLVKRYESRLMRYARYLVRDSDLAHDVVQDAFIKAFVNLKGFDTNRKFASWIYRIVHNEAMNAVKKIRHISWEEGREVIEVDGSEDGLEEEIDKSDLVKVLRRVLDKMPFKYREPLILFFIEELSYEEISEVMRMPVGTVGTRINRGKKILMKNYEKLNNNKTVESEKMNISEAVMSEIKGKDLRMHSYLYFWLIAVLLGTGTLGLFITAVVFVMRLWVQTRVFGAFSFLSLGRVGWVPFVTSFPWLSLVTSLAGLGLGIYLLRKYEFSYKKNFLVIAVVTIAVAVLAGGVLGQVVMKREIHERPRAGWFFDKPMMHEKRGVMGDVVQVGDEHILIKSPRGELVKVRVGDEDKRLVGEDIKVGERIVVVGEWEGDELVFQAMRQGWGGKRFMGDPRVRGMMRKMK